MNITIIVILSTFDCGKLAALACEYSRLSSHVFKPIPLCPENILKYFPRYFPHPYTFQPFLQRQNVVSIPRSVAMLFFMRSWQNRVQEWRSRWTRKRGPKLLKKPEERPICSLHNKLDFSRLLTGRNKIRMCSRAWWENAIKTDLCMT